MARSRSGYLFVVVPWLLAVPRAAFAQSVDASSAPPSTSETAAETASPTPSASDAVHLTVVLDAGQRLSVIHRDAQGNVVWQSTVEESDPIAALILTLLLTTSVPHRSATPRSHEAPRTPSRPTLPAAYEAPAVGRLRGLVDRA